MKKPLIILISLVLLIEFTLNSNATTFLPECQDENYLFENSELVVMGTVATDMKLKDDNTYVTIAIDEYLKGNGEKELKILIPGNQVTTEGGTIPGMARFYKGEKVKLYLYELHAVEGYDINEDIYTTMCGEFGKKVITVDDEFHKTTEKSKENIFKAIWIFIKNLFTKNAE